MAHKGEEVKEEKIEKELYTIYESIRGVVFEASYLGKRHMTLHLRCNPTERPVYEIVSGEFEKKLASIVKQVTALGTTKEVWRGISGPPKYINYWLWASEESKPSEEFDTASYQVTKISVKPLSYDSKSDYSFFVNMDVEAVEDNGQ